MMQRSSCLALACLFFATVSVRAESVVDTHIKAIGGQQAIAAIKTIKRTGKVAIGGPGFELEGKLETICVVGQKSLQSMDLGAIKKTMAWNGKEAWVRETNKGVKSATKEQEGSLKSLASVNIIVAIKSGGGSFVSQGVKEFEGVRCQVLKAGDLTAYVDDKSKMLVAMTVTGAGARVKVTYADFEKHQGVTFANKETIDVGGGETVIVYEFTRTQINADVDQAKFERTGRNVDTQLKAVAEKLRTDLTEVLSSWRAANEKILNDAVAAGELTEEEANARRRKLAKQVSEQLAKAAQPAAAKPTGRVTAKQIIQSMDKDGDGKIAKEEAPEQLKPFFAQIDVNKDGAIDIKEAQAMADYENQKAGDQTPAPASGRVTAKQIIQSMDKNGDDKITMEEAPEQLKPFFAQIDTNQDGAIDIKEAQAMADYRNNQRAGRARQPAPARKRTTAQQIVRSMDKNRDGRISKAEASEDLKLFFDNYDKNKDGAIDAKEAQAIANYVNGQAR